MINRINNEKKNSWHIHEKRIKNKLKNYYEKQDYLVSFNRYYDTFDVVCAKINEKSEIEEIIGIEIKSDKDQILRLEYQLVNYIRIFDRVYLALESKTIPDFIPPYIGIIRCNDHILFERDAQFLYLKPENGNPINFNAISNTIKRSGGIKSRSKELMVYISGFEKVKRKLIYNSIFYDNYLPFSKGESKIVTFINKNYKEIKDLELFSHYLGDVTINGE